MHMMGKERDPESNLDDFGARFYSSTFGRWMSPDWSDMPEPVPYADLTNPQSLNLYALVRGNPETFADLDGHDPDAQGPGNLTGTNGLGPCQKNEPCSSTILAPSMTQEQQAAAQAKAQIPLQAAQNNTVRGAVGALEFILGAGLVATTLGGDAPGGAVGAVLIANSGLIGVSTATMGITDMAGTATNTDTSKADRALQATGNLGGLAVTSATLGNMKAGQGAATLTNAASLAVSPRDALRNPATVADAARTVAATSSLIQQSLNGLSSLTSEAISYLLLPRPY
jgi:RHS repeat-associated protein